MNAAQTALQKTMCEADLGAVALVPGPNLLHVTGAPNHASERLLLYVQRADGARVAVVPELEVGTFRSGGDDTPIEAWDDASGVKEVLERAAAQLDLDGVRVGVEHLRMRVFEQNALAHAWPYVEITPAHEDIGQVRLRKTPHEINAIRDAVKLAEDALESVLARVKVGMTEAQLARMLEGALRDAGSGPPPFGLIVAAGANAANPHAPLRDDVPIRHGDALLFDWGAHVHGYPSDLTRTVFVGEPDPEAVALYRAVEAANVAGRRAIAPGVSAGEVDRITRQVLVDAGFESLVLHRTGHGLGREIHEPPYLVHGNEQVLEPGMVMTVEPGLYQPGVLGVRIEDDVVVTESGADSLSTMDRSLRVISG